MDWIALENFRCFKDTGRVALRPLNLLVGENSSGKSSFLAAVRLAGQFLNGKFDGFNEEPFQLGSPSLVARKLGKDRHASSFGIRWGGGSGETELEAGWSIEGSASHVPKIEHMTIGFPPWNLKIFGDDSRSTSVVLERDGESGEIGIPSDGFALPPLRWLSLPGAIHSLWTAYGMMREPRFPDTRLALEDLQSRLIRTVKFLLPWARRNPVLAPIRSRPKRTYDSVTEPESPEGTHVPALLADLARNRPAEWAKLRASLERFGRDAGLFHSIQVESLGKHDAAPFQIEVRLGSARAAPQNIVDVGYGVSQILPILVELLLAREGATALVQQPEVHLHPQAQASFGSLLANLAAKNGPAGGALLVETHSDHLMDRVRIDVRKGVLAPEAVQILYFERATPTEVRIHPIGIDDMGNLIDTPDGYREFFLQEKMRFLGLGR